MAWSPASMRAVRLAAGWVATLAAAAVFITHLDTIRASVASRLASEDIAATALERSATAHTVSVERRVEIRAGRNGHFETTAQINGRPIDVMVDTGASLVALTWEDAKSAGILLGDGDFRHRVSTANGVARVAAVTLDSITIQDITVRNVRAAVAERGKLPMTLLGMSFLAQLGRAEMSRGVLVLEE